MGVSPNGSRFLRKRPVDCLATAKRGSARPEPKGAAPARGGLGRFLDLKMGTSPKGVQQPPQVRPAGRREPPGWGSRSTVAGFPAPPSLNRVPGMIGFVAGRSAMDAAACQLGAHRMLEHEKLTETPLGTPRASTTECPTGNGGRPARRAREIRDSGCTRPSSRTCRSNPPQGPPGTFHVRQPVVLPIARQSRQRDSQQDGLQPIASWRRNTARTTFG